MYPVSKVDLTDHGPFLVYTTIPALAQDDEGEFCTVPPNTVGELTNVLCDVNDGQPFHYEIFYLGYGYTAATPHEWMKLYSLWDPHA
jgi:hypothetical protein